MAQKPLVDTQELRQSLGLMDHEDVTASLDRAIIGAQIYFEELLQTKLMKQSNSDNFCINPQLIYVIPNGYYRLRLKNSLVRADTPVSIKVFDTFPSLITNQGGQVLSLAAGDFFVDATKGVAHINQQVAASKMGSSPNSCVYVNVVYDSGYANKGEASEWLKEAISSYVPVIITQKQVTNRSEQASEVYKTGREHAFNLLTPYLRDVGFCFGTV